MVHSCMYMLLCMCVRVGHLGVWGELVINHPSSQCKAAWVPMYPIYFVCVFVMSECVCLVFKFLFSLLLRLTYRYSVL